MSIIGILSSNLFSAGAAQNTLADAELLRTEHSVRVPARSKLSFSNWVRIFSPAILTQAQFGFCRVGCGIFRERAKAALPPPLVRRQPSWYDRQATPWRSPSPNWARISRLGICKAAQQDFHQPSAGPPQQTAQQGNTQ